MSKLKWIAALAVTLFFGPVFGQTNSLPKPTGKYFVGVTYLGFTDEKRMELFDNDQKLKRNITVNKIQASGSGLNCKFMYRRCPAVNYLDFNIRRPFTCRSRTLARRAYCLFSSISLTSIGVRSKL